MQLNLTKRALEQTHSQREKVKAKLPIIPSGDVPRLPIYRGRDVKLMTRAWLKFNDIVGNPIHPRTMKPCPMVPTQIAYHNTWLLTHRVAYNKSRKRGATEAGLRVIAEQCFDSYIGHKVAIISGNRQEQADDYLTRFDDLFWGPNDKGWTDLDGRIWKHDDLVMSKSSSNMELYSGVELLTVPAQETAVRGLENIKACYFVEAAHIKRIEDGKIYTATHPLAANDDTMDFIMETTPNGKRGFFYRNFVNLGTEYFKLQYDYHSAIDEGLMTQAFIDSEMNNPEIDWRQEYCCEFTTALSAAFDEKMVARNFKPIVSKRWEDILGPQSKP